MPVEAQTVNVLDYFQNTTPACDQVSPAPCSAGSTRMGDQSLLIDGSACSQLPLYFLRKGTGAYPWASETFWVRGQFLTGVEEHSYNPVDGTINTDPNLPNRVFRELSNHYKGVPYMPLVVGTTPSVINVPFSQEVWVDAGGQISCNGDHVKPDSYSESFSQWSETYFDANTAVAIYDCRGPAGCNYNSPGWASVVVRKDHWGSGNVETYTFGRWWDPRTGQYEGLGLIQWDAIGPDWNPSRHEPAVELRNAPNTWIPCATCPDY